jgi:signal transduction histidine kinase/CheY-like chemotaxis protein
MNPGPPLPAGRRTLRRRLLGMMLSTAGLALAVAGGLLFLGGAFLYQRELGRQLESLAHLVGESAAPVLEFADVVGSDEGQAVLDVLGSSPAIRAAALYPAPSGPRRASYCREAGERERYPFPENPPAAGFDGRRLTYVAAVRNEAGKELGWVYLEADHAVLWSFYRRFAGLLLLALVVAAGGAVLLARRLHRGITDPVVHLWEVAGRVRQDRDYSLRADRRSDGELGQLTEGFNQMLAEIQGRDAELEQHRRHLSEQVAERTRELSRVNADLVAAKERAEEARAAADAANRAKSHFLANVSHELRTPLNAIIGYSEMLQEEVGDLGVAALGPDLQKIHTAGKHLLALINDILDLAKVEAGKMTLFLETFDIATAVRDVAATVEPLIAKNGNRLEVVCPDGVGSMHADLTKVRQTLFNLLSNASKFTENGLITLRVERRTGDEEQGEGWKSANEGLPALLAPRPSPLVTFSVSDTGIGMTPAQLGKLFRAFGQADPSTTRKYGGTGLGLVISQRFCQLMGGDLAAVSEAGRGSTFTVTLPAEVRPLPTDTGVVAIREASLTRPGAGSGDGSLVLVIDDDANARDLLRRALTREGYRVSVADGGVAGLALARELGPAAITLDVMMPGMDGWSVLAALKGDPATADIPVIMVTMVDEGHVGFALGAADYLVKPVDWGRLAGVLEKHRRTAAAGEVPEEERRYLEDQVLQVLPKSGASLEQFAAEVGRVVGLAQATTPRASGSGPVTPTAGTESEPAAGAGAGASGG